MIGLIIAVAILLLLLIGVWYVWATPAVPAPVVKSAPVDSPTLQAAPPAATNTAGVGSLPVAAAPAGDTWEYIDNGSLAGGSGMYGYKSGSVDVFPTWESCRDRCAADETCGGFWWTNSSHQGCYRQGLGTLSFLPGGGGGTKAGIKRF